jgi:hypothetical protein
MLNILLMTQHPLDETTTMCELAQQTTTFIRCHALQTWKEEESFLQLTGWVVVPS